MSYKILAIFLSISLPGLHFIALSGAQRDSLPDGYPDSLIPTLDRLSLKLQKEPTNVNLLVELGHVYFNMGDDLFQDEKERLSAYGKGKQIAKKALTLDETQAEAHFVYAMNLGSEAKLKGITAGMLHLDEILRHVHRTIELQPDHAPALQMLGGLLAELPWFAGGNEKAAKQYLSQAIKIDGNYTKARLFLAKLYLKEGNTQAAIDQLEAVIHSDSPHYPFTWNREYRPEAEKILQSIDKELVGGS